MAGTFGRLQNRNIFIFLFFVHYSSNKVTILNTDIILVCSCMFINLSLRNIYIFLLLLFFPIANVMNREDIFSYSTLYLKMYINFFKYYHQVIVNPSFIFIFLFAIWIIWKKILFLYITCCEQGNEVNATMEKKKTYFWIPCSIEKEIEHYYFFLDILLVWVSMQGFIAIYVTYFH